MNKSKNSTSITVRLSAAERQKLEQDSRAAGLSTSDYIQTLLRGVLQQSVEVGDHILHICQVDKFLGDEDKKGPI